MAFNQSQVYYPEPLFYYPFERVNSKFDLEYHIGILETLADNVFLIIGSYIFMVFAGKKLMENRRPYDLKKALFVWNMLLAVFSICAFHRGATETYYVFAQYGFKGTVCIDYPIYNPRMIWVFLTAYSKIAEFGDTVFLVLRKRPIIFLHWFHHASTCGMMLICWKLYHQLHPVVRWIVSSTNFFERIFQYFNVFPGCNQYKRSSASSGCLELFNTSLAADLLLLLMKQKAISGTHQSCGCLNSFLLADFF